MQGKDGKKLENENRKHTKGNFYEIRAGESRSKLKLKEEQIAEQVGCYAESRRYVD